MRSHQTDLVQNFLPQLFILGPQGLVNWRGGFETEPAGLRLEIGFGGGEHLFAEAVANPGFMYFGCEPFVNGVAKILARIEETGLSNLRVHAGDAVDVLRALPEASVDRIDLLYPDPWPKRRQKKRRFVSSETVADMARVLRPGGLWRFATDIDDYAGWTLARALVSPEFEWLAAAAPDWLTPWRGFTRTRYEAKAIAAGRQPVYLTFRRR